MFTHRPAKQIEANAILEKIHGTLLTVSEILRLCVGLPSSFERAAPENVKHSNARASSLKAQAFCDYECAL